MAIITCLRCKREVDSCATRCAKCGWELPEDMCPQCGSMNTKIVVFGLYSASPAVGDDEPKYVCKTCGKRFG